MSFETIHKRFLGSIGTRLTLWGAGLTTLLITIVSVLLYAGMSYSMQSQIDGFLEGEIHEFMLTVGEHPSDDAFLESYFRNELGARTRHDLGFRLIDVSGKVLVSSSATDALAGLWNAPPSWYTNAPRVMCETLYPRSVKYPYRVCSLRTETADGRTCTAQSSYLLDQMTESLAGFRRVALAILVMSPLAAIGLGGFLARRSLRPVRRIIETARSIGTRDLRTRLVLSGTGDEMDQLSSTLNSMLDRIEQKVREIQRFTANASHELKTPLTALRGNAELALSRERSREELRLVVEENIAQYERLQRIAEDLLLLARIDAHDINLERKPVSLDAVLEDVRDLYAPIAEEKELHFVVEKPQGLVVVGDGGRLRQVVGNLVDNAIKYTPAPGRVTLSASLENGSAAIRVSDTGVGIPVDDLPKVFDRFYRADPARSSSSVPGAGLGLSICRSIIEAHSGTIRIESVPGGGTTVSVFLPVGGRGDCPISTR